jgi:hypothetical protein
MKKILILSLFLIVILAGCTAGNNNQTANSLSNKEITSNEFKEEVEKKEDTASVEVGRFNENMEEISYDDLIVGQRVMVFGDLNDGGSVTASRVTVGSEDTDFRQMIGMMMPSQDNQADIDNEKKTEQDGERLNFEQMQNMTEEERAKFREERRGQMGSGTRQKEAVNSGIIRVSGEIIDKDDMTLTLKSDEGGSRIVFIEENSVITAIKEEK